MPWASVPEEFYQARKKLGDEAHKLPQGVFGPFINDEYSDVTFALYSVEAPGLPPRQLTREAETLRQRILQVPGVKKIDIVGERPERIFVEFSYERLATLGVSARDICDALVRENAVTPSGSIDTKAQQVYIRLDGALDDLDKIRNTTVVAGGRTLKPQDLAHIVLTHAHADHIGGAHAVQQWTGAPAYMHAIDAPIARGGGPFRALSAAPGVFNHLLTFAMVGRIKSVDPLTVDRVIEHEVVLPFGGGLQVIHAPGHCAGQIALRWQNRGVLFAADTCMNLRGPRWSIAYENFAQAKLDLQRISKLNFDVACFGHGDPILDNASAIFRQKFGHL